MHPFIINRKNRTWRNDNNYDYSLATRRQLLPGRARTILIDFDNTIVDFDKATRFETVTTFRRNGTKDVLDCLADLKRKKPFDHIVIVTNQKKMSIKREALRSKLDYARQIMEARLKCVVSIVACTSTAAQKPNCADAISRLPFKYTQMIGDAGGRHGDYGRQDIDFARALQIPFLHAEDFLQT